MNTLSPILRFYKKKKPQSFDDNKTVARQGGHVAGTARKEIEAQTSESIVNSENSHTLRLENKKTGANNG